MADRPLAVLEGVLERITYANEENGYTVARVDTGRGAGDLLTVVGALLGAQPGESPADGGPLGLAPAVRQAVHRRELHDRAARHRPGHPPLSRLRADQGHRPAASPTASSSTSASDTLDVIEEEPKRLIEVPGPRPQAHQEDRAPPGRSRRRSRRSWSSSRASASPPRIAVRIYKKYGDASISVVKNQPYRLAADVWGIGFLTADRSPRPSASRTTARSGSRPACSTRCPRPPTSGHCYLPRGAADRRRGQAAPGRHRPGHRLPRRAGRRRRRRGPRRGSRRPTAANRSPPSTWCPSTAPRLSLAAQLLRLLRAAEDRMPAFRDVDWDKALAWLRDAHRRRARPRAGGRPSGSR